MRQTGYLAAAAAYALTHHFPLLPRVHALAQHMQHGLQEIGVGILSPAETCMVCAFVFEFHIKPIVMFAASVWGVAFLRSFPHRR